MFIENGEKTFLGLESLIQSNLLCFIRVKPTSKIKSFKVKIKFLF